jgi:hypothetical protein
MSDQTIPLSDKDRADMLRLMYDEKCSELSAALARADAEEKISWGRLQECVWIAERLTKAEAERDAALAKLARYETLRPASEWHEDYGQALWWRVPFIEEPRAGFPSDEEWDASYYTHWTPLPDVKEAKS